MGHCKKIKLAQRYADGEMAARERAVFESHAAVCGVCRAYLKEVESLKSAIGREQAANPPYLFEEKIIRLAGEMKPPRPGELFWENVGSVSRRYIPATALACLLMFFVAFAALRTDDSAATVARADIYYNFPFENHEKALLASDSESAAENLYTSLTDYSGGTDE
ncbi:MAG: zf-HC2 domain-containing protein [bacterium]